MMFVVRRGGLGAIILSVIVLCIVLPVLAALWLFAGIGLRLSRIINFRKAKPKAHKHKSSKVIDAEYTIK